MAGMRPEEAEQFYEEDGDPAKVFAIFGAARAQGRLGRTRPPGKYQPPDLTYARAARRSGTRPAQAAAARSHRRADAPARRSHRITLEGSLS
jgi:hypothetical protein